MVSFQPHLSSSLTLSLACLWKTKETGGGSSRSLDGVRDASRSHLSKRLWFIPNVIT